MRRLHRLPLASALCFSGLARAADAVYVTDLDIFSLLAPCAAEAVSYNIATLTYGTQCGDSEKELQSCVCSNSALFTSVTSSISTDVGSSCGSTATDDQQSASKVVQQYCNPDTTITFSTPTKNVVQVYITDLPQLAYLPPCAQSALSEAVIGSNLSRCPQAASLFAPCVCSKPGIPAAVSDIISKSVRYSCSNGEDVTAAQGFYSEYCDMNNGTTTFTPPPGPPGDMTYHITALSQFKSLRSCAQSGVSEAILDQTGLYCASGPQALASCVCLKSGMSNKISSTLTSNVKYYCDNTATADLTSALDVFDLYCSAADKKVVVSVSETATESYSLPAATGSRSPSPSETGSSGSGNDNDGKGGAGDSSSDNGNRGSGSINKTAVIAACVLGGAVAIALVGIVACVLRRRRQKKTKGEQLRTIDGPDLSGPPELDDTAKMAFPSAAAVPELNGSERQELQGSVGIVSRSELPSYPPSYPPSYSQSPRLGLEEEEEEGDGAGSKIAPAQTPPRKLTGTGTVVQALSLLGRRTNDTQGTPTVSPEEAPSRSYAAGWQSGPVEEAYELDSTPTRKEHHP